MPQATSALQGYIDHHPNAALRAFSISRMTSACTRCWSFLDRRPFVNGGFEEGGDAQRYKQVGLSRVGSQLIADKGLEETPEVRL